MLQLDDSRLYRSVLRVPGRPARTLIIEAETKDVAHEKVRSIVYRAARIFGECRAECPRIARDVELHVECLVIEALDAAKRAVKGGRE